MALFDRLMLNDGTPKVVDVGSASFDRFFRVVQEIGFLKGAERRSIDPIILFMADPHPRRDQGLRRSATAVSRRGAFRCSTRGSCKDRQLRDKFPRAPRVPLRSGARAHAEADRDVGRSFADAREMPLDPVDLAW